MSSDTGPRKGTEAVERFMAALGEGWRTGDFSGIDEVVAPDARLRLPGMPPDREGLKAALPAFRAAFPDYEATIEDVFAEGDRVADRITWRATHRGDLMGIPATGKEVRVQEIHLHRIAGGKIVERSGEWSRLTLMQQLGVAPAPPPAPPATARPSHVGAAEDARRAREVVHRIWDAFGRHDFDGLDALVTPDFVNHDPALPAPDADLATLKAALRGSLYAALPDVSISVHDTIAEAGRVAVRWSFDGTHSGAFPGEPPIPATGKRVVVTAASIHHVAGGRVSAQWVIFDAMGLMQQIGAIPAP